jgi:hypothetical protein
VAGCTRSNPCARCRDQRDPGAAEFTVPAAPGPVAAWLCDGWWLNAPAGWWGRGLTYEVGTRATGALMAALHGTPPTDNDSEDA